MPSEITVQEGLAPYHFAGMVFNPSKGSLNKQTQRLLVIGRYEQGEIAKPSKEGLQQITSSIQISDYYPNKDSQISKMLEAVFKANPMVECYAIAISDSESSKPSWDFSFSNTEEKPGNGELILGVCGLDPIIVKYEESEFQSDDGKFVQDTLAILTDKLKASLDMAENLDYDISLESGRLTLTHKDYVNNSNQLSLGIELRVPGFKVERSAFKRGNRSTQNIQQALNQLP